MKTKKELLEDGILKEHNIPTYQKAISLFESGENRVGIVQATGTGKSYLILQFLNDYVAKTNKRAIVLEPLYGIVKQFKDLLTKETFDKGMIFDDILVTHYDQLKTLSEDELRLLDYDYIILDEFHGLGAEGRGRVVQSLLKTNPNAKILGVTATPIRYLDKKRDMGDELFGDNIVRGMNVTEAIRKGVLPTPDYVMAVYSYADTLSIIEDKIKGVKDKRQRELLEKDFEKAKKQAENAEKLDELFARKINKTNGKFIAFCPNIERMESLIGEIKNGLFDRVNKDVEIYKITYKDGRNNANEIIKKFEEDKSDKLKIMLAVDMFNEGIHVKDVDGCMMFRPTISPRIYLQQLGRVLSVREDENFKPLVFDVVNNIQCLDMIIEAFDDDQDDADKNKGKKGGKKGGAKGGDDIEDIFPFEIDGNDLELNKFLWTLDKFVSENTRDVKKWLACSKRYYDKFGNLNVSVSYVEEETELKLGGWLNNLKTIYKENPASVNEKVAKYLMTLDANVFNYSQEYSNAQRDKMIIDSLIALNNAYPNEEPHMVSQDDKSLIDKSFNLGAYLSSIKVAIKKGDCVKFSKELIEEINKINPYALLGVNDARDLKIINALKTLNAMCPNEEPHLVSQDAKSPIDSSFNLGKYLSNIKLAIKKDNYTIYSKELIERINKINPYAVLGFDEARDLKIINGLKALIAKHSNEEPRFVKIYEKSPIDSSFALGSYLGSIRRALKKNDTSNYSKEFIEEINRINPYALLEVNDVNNLKIINGLKALNAMYPNEEPHIVGKKEKSPIDSSFLLGSYLSKIRKAIKDGDYSVYTKELIEEINKINPYALLEENKVRDLKIISALKTLNITCPNSEPPVIRSSTKSPIDSSFNLGSYLERIRAAIKKGDYSVYSRELIEEINKVNPNALKERQRSNKREDRD